MTIIHSFFIDLYILDDSWDCGSLPHKNVNIQPYMFFLFPYFSIKIIQYRLVLVQAFRAQENE